MPNPRYEWVITFKFSLYSNHLERKVQPTLIIQELQTIKLKQHNISYIKIIKFNNLLRDDYHPAPAVA
jgi:hypothetical protein